MAKGAAQQHADWLRLIDASGPFLTVPVLKQALPQGLNEVEPDQVAALRQAYEEWSADPEALHRQWIDWVLNDLLDFDRESLREGEAIPEGLRLRVPEQGETLFPDAVVVDPESGKARLIVAIWPPGQELDSRPPGSRWSAAPLDRLAEHLRGKDVRLGLATNGEDWVVVDAPRKAATGFAPWSADLWLQERLALRAFVTLLGARRFFGVPAEETLEIMLSQSAEAQEEVTETLGKQVKAAVELLVDAMSKANRAQGGRLLKGIGEPRIYEAAVTVMMRLVFLLSAEERRLFLLGDPLYDSAYAVSTLREQIREEADRLGEEPLERRHSAWARLLATFRMVHGGAQHERLRLPAYGGRLFDPDRFPFLEGRSMDEPWRKHRATPVPIDDRTVLHILDALQVLRIGKEARRLSFRSLDVEQIGHVYEGLLDHTAVWVTAPALALKGKKEPERALEIVEQEEAKGRESFVSYLHEITGLSEQRVERLLDAEPDELTRSRLRDNCEGDDELAERILPFLGLLREDLRGYPKVFLEDSVYVTYSTDRRSTGTYYTPRSLAEEIVRYALETVVYDPGPAQTATAEKWKLKTPAELLELKVCDPAMGSGAFLVAACRYLADRLIESWDALGEGSFTVEGRPTTGAPGEIRIPEAEDERALLARRLVAERCLYGVDKNPMAVEMAKLSLWLITLGKGKPFTFLSHALKCGDSLLGVTSLDQVRHFHMDPNRGQELHMNIFGHSQALEQSVDRAVQLRRELESFTVTDVRDAQRKVELETAAAEATDAVRVVADAVTAAALNHARDKGDALDSELLGLAEVAASVAGSGSPGTRGAAAEELRTKTIYLLDEGRPSGQTESRRAFHWPLEFPEVFGDREPEGFDAVVGNPPFQGGQKLTGELGHDYREHLVRWIAGGQRGSADLCSYFLRRGYALVRHGGSVGMLATNTIGQGDTREVGLERIAQDGGSIARAEKSCPWPGSASLEISEVWLHRNSWEGERVLDGSATRGITPSLDPQGRVSGPAHQLAENRDQSFIGSYVLGMGFVLEPEEAQALIAKDPRNRDVLFPYLNGQDLNQRPDCSPSRWVINFHDWPIERAKEYPDCFAIVEEKVRPERAKSKRKVRRERWWQFAERSPALYRAIEELERVIAVVLHSNTVIPNLVDAKQVFTHGMALFVHDDFAWLGLLSSDVHRWWAITQGSTLGAAIRYTPSDCFETFPQPDLTPTVEDLGEALHTHRRALMLDRQEGLTTTYNHVHDPDDRSADTARLREIHVDLDYAVRDAYGWQDLELDHDFYDTRWGTRFTLGPAVRQEILDRLLELNHERYAEEVRRGLHDKTVKARGRRKRTEAARPVAPSGQMELG